MSRLARELPLFLLLAGGLHVVAWPQGGQVGAQSSGAGGQALVSLSASSASLEALVRAWETPPAVTYVAPRAPNLPNQPAWSESPPELTPAIREPGTFSLPPAMFVPTTRSEPPPPSATLSPSPPVPEVPEVPTLPTMPVVRPQTPADLAPEMSPRPPDRPADFARLPATRQPRTQRANSPRQRVAQPQPQSETPRAWPRSQDNASRPAQTARGAGARAQAGDRQRGEVAVNNQQAQQQLARWGAQIRTAIERRRQYPRGTRVRGTVRIALTVSTSGQLISARLSRSSGHAVLDEAAMTAVRRARLPRARGGVPAGNHRFQIALAFSR